MSQKIVVADGKKFALKKACEILEASGYEIYPCDNGVAAQEVAKKVNADLIVADYLMPEKSGMGLVFELRQKGDKTPIVIMSESPLVTSENIIKTGGNGLVRKPIVEKNLVEVVSKAIVMK